MLKKLKQKSWILIAFLVVLYTSFISSCVPIFGQRGAMGHGSMGNWRVWWSDFALLFLIIIFLFLFLLYIISRRKNTNRLEEKEALNPRDNATEVLKERNKWQKG
jgi:uncharacterized membrane protein